MFIEFIFSGNTRYAYWLVFISPFDNKKNLRILYPTNS